MVKKIVRGADIIQSNSRKAAVIVESYTGPAVVVFEKMLTSKYFNMKFARQKKH